MKIYNDVPMQNVVNICVFRIVRSSNEKSIRCHGLLILARKGKCVLTEERSVEKDNLHYLPAQLGCRYPGSKVKGRVTLYIHSIHVSREERVVNM